MPLFVEHRGCARFQRSDDHASASSTTPRYCIAGEFAENKPHKNQQSERTGARNIPSQFRSKYTKRARNRNGGSFGRIDARSGSHGPRQRLIGEVEPDNSSTLRKANSNSSIPDAMDNRILMSHCSLELFYKSCFDHSSCKIPPTTCIRERIGHKESQQMGEWNLARILSSNPHREHV